MRWSDRFDINWDILFLRTYRIRQGFPVFHFDLYRLNSVSEVLDIGFDDYLNRDGLALIEWPEIIEKILSPDTKRIYIAHSHFEGGEGDVNKRIIRYEC